jgi:hypothetical protein
MGCNTRLLTAEFPWQCPGPAAAIRHRAIPDPVAAQAHNAMAG